ncbi:Si-specific NAD(P)(+) transhydrogenase [Acidihalobacter ferrooxydans]|uniref:Soluble pyridine nucleotide transhydrogenase n=1 Tax=Acidihalobacter ferrooxydans TaxID=1765967 RepID=A0A1P8UEY2_9GAMM|nr:Si-specific NAD(P)(+) transhydrogenase [Acidihalobacter ferrooxydans]APZ42400.1 NAD(P)(+) transhydrogenase [Acidihalobacter ferrooxydans]
MTASYDVAVIGSGPAGEGAAMKLCKQGKRVAMIEMQAQVGGNCTHKGTIPSKALRHSVQLLADYRRHPLFAQTASAIEATWPKLLRSTEQAIAQQVDMRHRYYLRNHVALYHGSARFEDAHTLSITDDHGKVSRLHADNIVIATGSRPYRPPGVNFDHPMIVDSDTVLELDRTPRRVTIFGAGVIGCEYASIFANLDMKVNLVNTRDRLLSFLDDEITDALSYHLRDQGVVILHNEALDAVVEEDSGVVLRLKSGKEVRSDLLLWANGRSGNTETLALEACGLSADARGQIPVNDRFQTAVPNIFAVGDVVGPPALASASYDQGRFVGQIISKGEAGWKLIEEVPTGIYTSPEISSLGRTESELTAQHVPYEVGRAEFKNLARAQIDGHKVGILKLLFHRETRQLLGIHCFGEQASEIVHIGQAIMAQPGTANSINYFSETTFNYPTMAEAYRVAALYGLNRIR